MSVVDKIEKRLKNRFRPLFLRGVQSRMSDLSAMAFSDMDQAAQGKRITFCIQPCGSQLPIHSQQLFPLSYPPEPPRFGSKHQNQQLSRKGRKQEPLTLDKQRIAVRARLEAEKQAMQMRSQANDNNLAFPLVMSSVIDGQVFIGMEGQTRQRAAKTHQSFISELGKRVSGEGGCVFMGTQGQRWLATRVEWGDKQFVLTVRGDRDRRSVTIVAAGSGPKAPRIASRSMEVQFMKQAANCMRLSSGQAVYFIHQSIILMKLSLYLENHSHSDKVLAEITKKILEKGLCQFSTVSDKIFKTAKREVGENDKQLYCDLALSNYMGNTESCFDFSYQRSQYNASNARLEQRKSEIAAIEEGVEVQRQLQELSSHFFQELRQQCTSHWVRSNFAHQSQLFFRKYKNDLQVPKQKTRKLEDYLFNFIKVESIKKMEKPFCEGGSSYIHVATVALAYVSSHDHSSYSELKLETVEKLLAIKSLKPEYASRLKDKLQHEKAIVSKLRGVCSYFLPKYYQAVRHPELSEQLLMQHVNGEPLESYLRSRGGFISLRAKVYLLLTVIYSMRLLIGCEIVHMDLKPANIMVCKGFVCKLLDFGEAYHHSLPPVCSPGFTFPYIAPQAFQLYQRRCEGRPKGRDFTQKQDVFSFGILMYEMLFNNRFLSMSEARYRAVYGEAIVKDRIFEGGERVEDFGPGKLMHALLHLALRCIDPNPECRPRFVWIGAILKIALRPIPDYQQSSLFSTQKEKESFAQPKDRRNATDYSSVKLEVV